MRYTITLIVFTAILFCAGCAQEVEEGVVYMRLNVSSPVFEHNSRIPEKYTCDGEDINPPLHVEGIPDGTKSLVLIVDDPDATVGTWVHWIMWNIPVREDIVEDSIPGVEGWNSFRRTNYGGPCPPSGTHRYVFKVYALDVMLELTDDAKKSDVLKAMQGHVLAEGELIGLYGR